MARGLRIARGAALLAAGIALLAGASRGEPAPDAGWRALRPADAGFSVALPGAPTVRTHERLTPGGMVRMTEYRVAHDTAELRVELHSLPRIARWLLSDASLLDRAVSDLLDDERASASERRAEPFAGRPARATRFEVTGGRTAGRALLVLDGDRLVLLAALYPAAAPAPAEVERFVSSLRFGDE